LVLTVGDATTVDPDIWFSPAEGDHEYVVPPDAMSVTELPEQRLETEGVTEIEGEVGETITEHDGGPNPQALPALTHRVVARAPVASVIELVPCPLSMVAEEEAVHE
jgi:hypothetical protein